MATLDNLSDDCLLLIIEELRYEEGFGRMPMRKHVKQFSLVNQRFRTLSIPTIFNPDVLTFRAHGHDDDLPGKMQTVVSSSFMAPVMRKLSITFSNSRIIDWENFAEEKVSNDVDLYKELLPILTTATNLHTISLSRLKSMRKETRAMFRAASLTTIRGVRLHGISEPAMVIRACSGLESVHLEYPCAKLKTTLKVISDQPTIRKVDLLHEGWKAKDVEQIAEYMCGIQELGLLGVFKEKVTTLVTALGTGLAVRKLKLTIDPWVDEAYYFRHYGHSGSAYYEATSMEKTDSELNEDPMTTAKMAFEACKGLVNLTLLPPDFFDPADFSVERGPQNRVEQVNLDTSCEWIEMNAM